MTKSFVVGSIVGAIVVTASGAAAGYHMVTAAHSAEVISATQVFRTVKTPRQNCHDEQVTRTRPAQDSHRLVGTGIGAVVGGLLGNQVGHGNGRVLATVAGAAAGGYAGNKVQQKVQQGNTYTANEQRCVTVYDSSEESTGYDVVYRLKGEQRRIHMDHDPGTRIPVRDGQIVTESETAGTNVTRTTSSS
jgi:uncharacterized protein YcfJ